MNIVEHTVAFPACSDGAEKRTTVYLAEGGVLLLIARTLLEEWGVVGDFRDRKYTLSAWPENFRTRAWIPSWLAAPRSTRAPCVLDA